MACASARAAAFNKVVPPRVPIALSWTLDLDDGVAVPPVADAVRAYLALKSGHLAAYDLRDKGRQLWRIDRTITSPMAVDGEVLFLSADNAIEAVRGADHTTLWTAPRITTVAPLVAAGGWLIAVTETEVIAINAANGAIVWRKPAGGVTVAPAIDGDRLLLGTNDGRVLALALETGDAAWEYDDVDGGVTALAAYGGRVYAGGGDKRFYCLKKDGKLGWPVIRVGSVVIGQIAVDDERVYFAARDNVIRGLDRSNGNQRWQEPIRNRPFRGVVARGHIVFVPLHATHDLPMLFDQNGHVSGTITLEGDALQDLPPYFEESAAGVTIVVVTGGLSNNWQLSLYETTGEPALVPVADFLPDAGAFLLTDPVLRPIGTVMGLFVLGDPPLLPVSVFGFPVQLLDPPLEPLTILPGLQLRTLSPQLPLRRESSGPGG